MTRALRSFQFRRCRPGRRCRQPHRLTLTAGGGVANPCRHRLPLETPPLAELRSRPTDGARPNVSVPRPAHQPPPFLRRSVSPHCWRELIPEEAPGVEFELFHEARELTFDSGWPQHPVCVDGPKYRFVGLHWPGAALTTE